MKIKRHHDFLDGWKRFAFAYVLIFILGLSAIIYLGRAGYSTFLVDNLLWGFFFGVVSLLFYGASLPYRVRCPECSGSTVTKSSRAEFRDGWSAYCSTCDTLWDLGLGND